MTGQQGLLQTLEKKRVIVAECMYNHDMDIGDSDGTQLVNDRSGSVMPIASSFQVALAAAE